MSKIITEQETKGHQEGSKTTDLKESGTDVPSKQEVLDEEVYINYAGIVLLHPFFPSLFQNLSYLNEQHKWIDETSQIEAIYLLHYLTTGQEEPTEEELFVPKLLVGYPTDEVVSLLEKEAAFSASERVQEEMEALLEAIKGNWKPMRNCTWAGLRHDFLNRPAKVSQTDSMQYLLTIEPHALDVLLPFKNWGLSMIKYSWMEEVLNVEWG